MESAVIDEQEAIVDKDQEQQALDVVTEQGVELSGDELAAFEAATADMQDVLDTHGDLDKPRKDIADIAMRVVETHPLTQDDAAAAKEKEEKEDVVVSSLTPTFIPDNLDSKMVSHGGAIMTARERDSILSGEQNRK